MKRIISLFLIVALALSLCGCTHTTDKKIPTYFSDSPVESVRFYYFLSQDEEFNAEYFYEDLPAERIGELTETLNSMDLVYHGFHTDYYWAYKFGIEMKLEDGTYLTYDGTKLTLSNAPIAEVYKKPSSETRIKDAFIEVSNMDYWEAVKPFFPSTNDKELHTTSW